MVTRKRVSRTESRTTKFGLDTTKEQQNSLRRLGKPKKLRLSSWISVIHFIKTCCTGWTATLMRVAHYIGIISNSYIPFARNIISALV